MRYELLSTAEKMRLLQKIRDARQQLAERLAARVNEALAKQGKTDAAGSAEAPTEAAGIDRDKGIP